MFSTDIGIPAKNIPNLDEVDEGDKFSTYRAIQFSSFMSLSVFFITNYDINQYSASSISIGSHHADKRE